VKLTRGSVSRMLSKIVEIGAGTDKEPPPDMGICDSCGTKDFIWNFEVEQEGDWEEGYYDVHVCPYCDDGYIVDYDYSPEQLELLETYWERKDQKRRYLEMKPLKKKRKMFKFGSNDVKE